LVSIEVIQTIYYIVAMTGVIVAAINYLISTRNTDKARQAQMFMGLYEKWNTSESIEANTRIQELKINNYNEFIKMLRDNQSADGNSIVWHATYFEGMGVLVREKLIDLRLVSLFLHGEIKLYWEKFGPFFKQFRVSENYPRAWIEAEYLYDQVMDYGKKHL
jgi:hypothetical protein